MFSQIMIAVFGIPAVFLTQLSDIKFRKWASVFGLVGQPFWFYSAIENQQWGILSLSFVYAALWGFGFYTHWIKVESAS